MTPLTIILFCLIICLAGACAWLGYQLSQTNQKLNKLRQFAAKTTRRSTPKTIKLTKLPPVETAPFEQVLNLISGGILISDRDGVITWVNREAADLLGVTLLELTGKPLSHALSQLPLLPAHLENEADPTEFELNGRIVQGTIHVLYGSDGLDKGAVAILTDVTGWHTTLRVQQNKLDTINQELKDRLSYMGSTTKLLENSAAGPQKAWLPQLHENVGRVTELIETLVQTALVHSDESSSSLVPIHLSTLVNEVTDELKGEIKERKIFLKTDVDPHMRPILFQHAHMKTIVRELITNGLRFNRPGGMVQLTGKLQEEANEAFLVLNVSDDGQGIPVDDQKKIFDVFYRPNAHQEGSQRNIGVGLAIVQAIVQAYHGRIWFKSVPERGTVFTILLPAGNLSENQSSIEDEFDWIEDTHSS
ncbi:MAG: ATP-binding protein [Chloroflexota bacterium]